MAEVPSPDLQALPEQPRNSLGARIKARLLRPTAVLATSLALLGGDKAPQPTIEVGTKPVTPIEFVLGNQTHLDFGDLRAITTNKALPQIQPNPELQQIINTQEPVMGKTGLLPIKIKDPEFFAEWVNTQTQRPDLRNAVGIEYGKEPTAEQLVKLSAAILIANQTYEEPLESLDESVEAIKRVYALPIDEILKKKIPIQCEGYSAATLAVFNEIKKAYPETLKNTNMVTQSAIEAGHVWNLVLNVTSPQDASLSFLDASGDDPDYKDGKNIKLSPVELIEGLHKKGLIDAKTFYSLALQYEQSGKMTTNELREVLHDEIYLHSQTDPYKVPTSAHAKLAEAFIARPDAEIGYKGNVDKEFIFWQQKFLYNYYIDPNASDRPSDWYEKAQKIAEDINNSDVQGIIPQKDRPALRNIQRTPEEYKSMYPYGHK